ncbi:four helix bundle protein [Roseibacillus persicicus]|uniref:four helix bundle protein n=1 Tax=Roseibacillus persicicus TaxID=454148 RepID=UPI00398B04E9
MMGSSKTRYDLEDRTIAFALKVRKLLQDEKLPRVCWSDADQILRSSGSVGANYIEANDALSSVDKIYRIKISRKEAKESRYWAELLSNTLPHHLQSAMSEIQDEAEQLMKIFGTILKKLDPKWTPEQ